MDCFYYDYEVRCPVSGENEIVPVLCRTHQKIMLPLQSAGCDNCHGSKKCERCIDSAIKAAAHALDSMSI